MTKDSATTKRLTLNLRPADAARLDALTDDTGISANDAIRRALAIQDRLRQISEAGDTLMVMKQDGTMSQLELLLY